MAISSYNALTKNRYRMNLLIDHAATTSFRGRCHIYRRMEIKQRNLFGILLISPLVILFRIINTCKRKH